MKKLIFFIFLLLPAIASYSQQITTQQYIDTYKALAIEEMHRTGVPAAISLAQGIVESESGNGWLVQHSNNNFGIKCKDWAGPTIRYDDDKKNECFRKYSTAEESWRDHSDFLRNNVRYAFLFQLDPTDYKDWAYGLKSAGYATSPTYPEKLIQAISEYNLEQYTVDGLGIASRQDTSAVSNNTNLTFINETNQPDNDNTPVAPPANYPSGVFTINHCRVVYLLAGSSLLAIADHYHIKLRKLVSFNELPDDATNSQSELIFLQQKQTTGEEDYHLVSGGETMHSIAQQEGIQLKWLYKRNKMQPGQQPVPGDKLMLKGYAETAPLLADNITDQADTSSRQKKLSPAQFINNIKTGVNEVLDKKNNDPAPANNNDMHFIPDSSGNQPNLNGSGQTMANQPTDFSNNGIHYHIVQPAETMYAISRQYNISVAQLQQWNNLSGTDIKTGEQLIVGK